MTTGSLGSAVETLQGEMGSEWAAITSARDHSREIRGRIQELLNNLASEDASIVIFGSLAREEFTAGSDLDWTLLVDGHADSRHLQVVQDVSKRLEAGGFKRPGREGLFGKMAFSHNLLHQIGGEDDTNRNITQRILLLLESIPVGRREAYERVVRNVLQRYLVEDLGLWRGSRPHKVPRFLLNDIVRYWRTVAVDFVYKQRERGGEGWALRNAKLRMSRKLIFVAGLLTCFGCHFFVPPEPRASIVEGDPNPAPLVDHLLRFVQATPLQILAHELLGQPALAPIGRSLFDAYDAFLELLADSESRTLLESLPLYSLGTDPLFQRVREIGHVFEKALRQLFFDPQSRLCELTIRYGVF